MTLDEINAEIARATTVARFDELVREVQARRQWIAARLASISMPATRNHEVPPERKAAIAGGLDAVEKLDREEERLRREEALLDFAEAQIYSKRNDTELADIRRALPGARKQLPKQIDAARAAHRALDAALAELRGNVDLLGAAATLPGEEFPLRDDELAALLELREELWQPRAFPALRPPPNLLFPRSWSLYFSAPDAAGIYRDRAGPKDSRGDVGVIDDSPAPPREPFSRVRKLFVGRRG